MGKGNSSFRGRRRDYTPRSDKIFQHSSRRPRIPSPLTEEIRYRAYGALAPDRRQPMHLLYPAPDSVAGNLIDTIVNSGWRAVADTARIDVSPSTDDRPSGAARINSHNNASAR